MPATLDVTRASYLRLMAEESVDIADFVEGLDKAAWDAESLCRGWKTRHVISHMAVGHTVSVGKFLLAVAAGRGIPQASFRLAVEFGDAHSPEQIAAAFRAATVGRPKGAAALVAPPELFVDHLIHHQDIRRPLGLSRAVPADRLTAAITALPRIGGQLRTRARMKGLRLIAVDLDHSVGDGAEVRGTAEALVMAVGGRPAALSELEGPGVGVLAERLKSQAA